MMEESILEEAQRLIHGERNKNYGHPRDNFRVIVDLWNAYLGAELNELDVANLMILMKLARAKDAGWHRDSYTDIAGYAGCAERLQEPEHVSLREHLENKEAGLAEWERELLAEALKDDTVVDDPPYGCSFCGDEWCSEGYQDQIVEPPREWDFFPNIPHDVLAIRDREGSYWSRPAPSHQWLRETDASNPFEVEYVGPFVEVKGLPPTEGSE